MLYYIKLGLVLFLIAAVASAVLALINGITEPVIIENQIQLEIEARQVVLPQAETFEEVEAEMSYHRGLDEDGNLVGYTFMAVGSGYSGDIEIMVGVTRDLQVSNIRIIQQTETPGLGANCTRPEFTDQYQGLDAEQVQLKRDGGEVESITGATITARVVSDSISEAINRLEKQLEDAPEHKPENDMEEAA